MGMKKDDGLNAVKRYQAKCDAITIRPLKDEGEKIRSAALQFGFSSVTQFILSATSEYIKNHSE